MYPPPVSDCGGTPIRRGATAGSLKRIKPAVWPGSDKQPKANALCTGCMCAPILNILRRVLIPPSLEYKNYLSANENMNPKKLKNSLFA